MNKLKLVIFFLGLITIMSFKPITEWYQYDSYEFKVLFPKSPTNTIKKVNTETGEIEMTVYMYNCQVS